MATVRIAKKEDAKGIAKVHVDTWRTTYGGLIPDDFLDSLSYERSEERFGKYLSERDIFVAEEAGEVVGFAVGGPSREKVGEYTEYSAEIYAIYIMKEYHGNGIGRMLVERLFELFAEKGLFSVLVWVLEGNRAAGFYESMGGVRLGAEEEEIGGKAVNLIGYGWGDIRFFKKER